MCTMQCMYFCFQVVIVDILTKDVDSDEEIVKKLALKSYEGGYKVMIIWMAIARRTDSTVGVVTASS